MTQPPVAPADSDAQRLASLGYESEFKRDMSLLLSAVLPALLIVGSAVSADPLVKIISFSTLGIYLAFQMVVLAALRARVRGWKPSGEYRAGPLGPSGHRRRPRACSELPRGVAAFGMHARRTGQTPE